MPAPGAFTTRLPWLARERPFSGYAALAMPVLLRSREVPLQVVLAVAVPAAAGALAGWLLGINEIAYVVWSLLALLGGFFAGLEHDGAREGTIRGVLGGALFGAVLLLVHQAIGDEPKAKLPDPEVVLVVITALIGTVSGALGGRRRAKHEGEMAKAQQEEQEREQDEAQRGPDGAEQTEQQKAARREAKKAKAREPSAFSIKRLHWYEYLGFFGAAVLAASLFLPWFATSCASKAAAQAASKISPGGDCNPNSVYNGARGDFTAFQTFKYLDWLLVAACVAPFILAYIIARGHSLSWKPGEVTMIVGMIAFALILLNGIILGKPGDTVDMEFRIGWFVGLLAAGILMAAGTLRQALHADAAKPPGVM
jgi:hypothetical protein